MTESNASQPPETPPTSRSDAAESGAGATAEASVVDPLGLTVGELLRRVTPVAWVTPALTVLLVGSFLASALLGVHPLKPTAQQLLAVGGGFGPLLAEGQWWRLLSATVLHAGLMHLAFNLWALWNGGQFAERVFGNAGFLALYVLSGLGSSLLSATVKPVAVSVGASGAIFGIFGALFAFVLLHRGVFPPEFLREQRNSLLGFVGYNVLFGFMVPNIDLSGHVGGFLTGMAAGAVLQRDLLHPKARRVRRAVGTAALAGVLALAAVGTLWRIEAVSEVRAQRAADRAVQQLEAQAFDDAIRLYDEALTLVEPDPAYYPWLFNRGVAKLRKKDAAAALADFREAHRWRPGNESRAALCDASVRAVDFSVAKAERDAAWKGRAAEAIEACSEAAEKDPANAAPLAGRAAVQLELGELEEAWADVEMALERSPDAVWPQSLRLMILVERDDLAGAERACEPLMKHADTELSAWNLTMCAELSLRSEKLEAARELASRAIAAHSKDAAAFITRASAQNRLGKVAEARADLDRALALSPDDAAALNNRAWLRVEQGEHAEAKKDADRSLELRPDNYLALGTRCFALVGLGELAAARRDCARAVALAPEKASNLVDQGMLHFLDGNREKAVAAWGEASRQDPVQARQLAPWLERAKQR